MRKAWRCCLFLLFCLLSLVPASVAEDTLARVRQGNRIFVGSTEGLTIIDEAVGTIDYSQLSTDSALAIRGVVPWDRINKARYRSYSPRAIGAFPTDRVDAIHVIDKDHIVIVQYGIGPGDRPTIALLDLSVWEHEQKEVYTYAPGIDQPIARYIVDEKTGQKIKTEYYLQDAQKNVTEVMDENGEIVAGHVYSSYGKVVYSEGSGSDPYLTFTGREYEKELDAYFLRQRFYCPTIGRFLQEDPLEKVYAKKRTPTNEIPTNLYRYVSNNPVNRIDPLGIFATKVEDPLGASIGRGILAGGTSLSSNYLSAKINLALLSLGLGAYQLLEEEPLPKSVSGSTIDEYNEVIETLIPLASGSLGRLPPHCRDAFKDAVTQCIIKYGEGGTTPNRSLRNWCLQEALIDAQDCVQP